MVSGNWWGYFTERTPRLDHTSLRHIADTICRLTRAKRLLSRFLSRFVTYGT